MLENGGSQSNKIEIHIDMIPEVSKKELEGWLSHQLEQTPKITVGALFEKYIRSNCALLCQK